MIMRGDGTASHGGTGERTRPEDLSSGTQQGGGAGTSRLSAVWKAPVLRPWLKRYRIGEDLGPEVSEKRIGLSKGRSWNAKLLRLLLLELWRQFTGKRRAFGGRHWEMILRFEPIRKILVVPSCAPSGAKDDWTPQPDVVRNRAEPGLAAGKFG